MKNSSIFKVLVLSFFVMLFSVGNLMAAESVGKKPSEKILVDLSGEDLSSILQSDGYVTEPKVDSNGDPMIKVRVRTGSLKFNAHVMFYDKQANGRYSSIQIFLLADTNGLNPATITKKVNTFNSKRRFMKAYISANGSICAESDLDLVGGVTEKTVRNFISDFESGLMYFVIFMSSSIEDENHETTPAVAPGKGRLEASLLQFNCK